MGVFAPLVGIIGSMQAAEALKLLAGIGHVAGRAAADARRARDGLDRRSALPRQTGCPVCAGAARPTRIRARLSSATAWTPSAPTLHRPQLPERRRKTPHAVKPPARYGGPESAYRLAFTDTDFLLREELRPVRMQLELLKPELVQQEQGIESTIVIFGSARIAAARRGRSGSSTQARAGGDAAARRARRSGLRDEPLLRRGAALRRRW